MSEPLPPPIIDESAPKRGWLLLVTGWLVIAQSVLWIAIILAGCVQGDPFAFIGAVLVLPIATFLGVAQYASLIRRSRVAAQTVGILLGLMCAFWLFGMVANVGEALLDKSIEWRFLVGFIAFLLAIAASIGIAAWANWRWAKKLAAARAAKPSTKGSIFTLRELFGAVTVIAITTGFAAFIVRSEPAKFGEHVTRSEGPGGLPAGATDINFGRGYRGTIAYEFTIDEQSFIAWVNEGLGSIEAQSAGVQLRPIQTASSILRYTAFGPSPSDDARAVIRNGLEYHWSKEDRGVHAIYDRDSSRAYYQAHYH